MKTFILVIVMMLISQYSFSQKKQSAPRKVTPKTKVTAQRGPASDPNAPIEVHGQSRNLNMMLMLKNEKEAIDFIKLRKDYQEETQQMNY